MVILIAQDHGIKAVLPKSFHPEFSDPFEGQPPGSL